MTFVTREALLRRRFKTKKVRLESLDGDVHVRQLSGKERVDYETQVAVDGESGTQSETAVRSMARLVTMCLVYDTGKDLCTLDDLEQVEGSFPFDELQQVFNACLEVNGLSAAQLKEEVKNSEPVRN